MNYRTLALLFSLAMISQSTIISTSEKKQESERKLVLLELGTLFTGILFGFFGHRYTSSKFVSWTDDNNWEKRFLAITGGENMTLHFMNLLIDSYAMEVGNICISHFQSDFEESIKNYPGDSNYEIEIKSKAEDKMIEKHQICDEWFQFIYSHGFLSKFVISPKYALFYFKMYLRESGLTTKQAYLEFFDRMEKEIADPNPDNLFTAAEKTHQGYFYITINYFLTSQNNLKQMKVPLREIK